MQELTQEQLDSLRNGAELGTGMTLEDIRKAPDKQILGLYLIMSKAVLTLVDEVEKKNARLEDVESIVLTAVSNGDGVPALPILNAVRG